MKYDIATLASGGMLLDNIVGPDGRVALDQLGGNAVYAAAGAALWSSRVVIAANIPSNYPEQALDRLRAAGLSLEGVERRNVVVDEPEWFILEADGSRLDHVYGAPSLFMLPETRPLTQAERASLAEQLRAHTPSGLTFGAFRGRFPVEAAQLTRAGARAIHLAPEALGPQETLAKAGRKTGAVVTLDPGISAVRGRFDALTGLLADVDALLPSERELVTLFPGLSPRDALRRLATHTDADLAVKLGALGILLYDRTRARFREIPALPVAAVDPVGAGDAFCGGFTVGYAATGDAFEAAVLGTVSASFAVESSGAGHLLDASHEEALSRRADLLASMGETTA